MLLGRVLMLTAAYLVLLELLASLLDLGLGFVKSLCMSGGGELSTRLSFEDDTAILTGNQRHTLADLDSDFPNSFVCFSNSAVAVADAFSSSAKRFSRT